MEWISQEIKDCPYCHIREARLVTELCGDHWDLFLQDYEKIRPKNNEWISIHQRLPEELNPVICADGAGTTCGYIENKKWYRGQPGDNHHSFSKGRITHWMPLPPTPQ